MDETQGPLRSLYAALTAGDVSRRDFVRRASMLGVSAAGVAYLANTGAARAETASPEATAADQELVSNRPETGTEGQERGGGGALNLIQWQAPTILSPHVATGVKDFLGAIPVLEPLMAFAPDSTILPILVTEVPAKENGGLNDDLTEVVFNLAPDVVWSDGEPFTAEDVVFTVNWVLDPENAAVSKSTYDPIEKAEAVDELTVKVTFKATNPIWFAPFTGSAVYPKHVLEAGKEASEAFLSAPIGTGPYKVDSFTPNDQVTYSINENYREPNKPFFSTLNIKGGGDAASAARAVIQTGEADFAWNLQVEPEILTAMESDDAPGKLTPYPHFIVELVQFNFSDPNKEVDGQRSEMNTPNPLFSDDAVRTAIAMCIDRQKIADEFYGLGQPPAANVVYGDPAVESQNTEWVFDPDAAAGVLDEAGWTLNGDGVREKDGLPIKFVLATTVNSVRQKEQAVIKSNLSEIGIVVELEQVDPGIFFDGGAGTEQNWNHFYWDADMLQLPPNSPRPMPIMAIWYGGPDGQNIAQKSNGWTGSNKSRWQNADYDKLYEQAQTEPDPDTFADLFIQMNDILINDHVVVPLVVTGSPRGVSKRLNEKNLALAPFSYDYWNIANWNLAEDA